MKIRLLVALLLGALLAPSFAGGLPASAEEAKPDKIRLDYAYYNPSSLVLKRFGWLEEALEAEGIEVEWTLSAGSNKANEYLRSDAIDFGSTAGAAALLARANGSAIQAVYIFSQPEWTAIVVPRDSAIQSVAELRGKKIAATKGTDPYFFLLRALREAGLSQSDVEIINLQHADGKAALERGDVDAWAGLDPFMAQTELESGSRLLFRNIEYNTYGFLNAREGFIEKHPAYVPVVLAAYERARAWILANPEEAAKILSEEAGLSIEVAERELFERTNLGQNPVPGEDQTALLKEIIPIFVEEGQLAPDSDPEKALATLYNTQFIEQVLAEAAAAATPAP